MCLWKMDNPLLSSYSEVLGKPVPGNFPAHFPPFEACFMSKPLGSCSVAKNECSQEVLLQRAKSHSAECLWQKITRCRLPSVLRGSTIPSGACRRGGKKAFLSNCITLMQSLRSVMVCHSCSSEPSRLVFSENKISE